VTVALDGAPADETEAMERRRRMYSFDSYNGRTMLRQWTEGSNCSSLKGASEGVLYPRYTSVSASLPNYEWTVGRAMAQAVSRRPLNVECRVRARVNPCEICGRKSGTGTGFSPSSSVFPLSVHHSTVVLHTHISSGG
jgi:hypothetical protein